jgi:hypothetical protein
MFRQSEICHPAMRAAKEGIEVSLWKGYFIKQRNAYQSLTGQTR